MKLSANYDCEQNCVLEIYIDVIKVIEDNVSGLTTQIDSREFYCKELSPGSKQTLKAEFTMPK